MSGLCRDCRYWDRYDLGDPGELLGDCTLTIMVGGTPLHPESKARAYADVIFGDDPLPKDRRRGSLQTLEDFGCNQFREVE